MSDNQVILEAAVDAAAEMLEMFSDFTPELARRVARTQLEAAAPHMLAESDLMRWKLDALKEWSDAMLSESNSPQYGRDVKTILEVGSLEEAKEIDSL